MYGQVEKREDDPRIVDFARSISELPVGESASLSIPLASPHTSVNRELRNALQAIGVDLAMVDISARLTSGSWTTVQVTRRDTARTVSQFERTGDTSGIVSRPQYNAQRYFD